MTAEQHQKVSSAINKLLPYGIDYSKDIGRVASELKQIYRDLGLDDLVPVVDDILKQAKTYVK